MDARAVIHEIEKRRKSMGISTLYLSKVANVTTATYRNWRDGRTSPPYDSLVAMKEAIDAAESRLGMRKKAS